MVIDLSWLDVTQIIWMLLACWACFYWGKEKGIEEAVTILIEDGHLNPDDLD
jgi:hypothetical protein